MLVHKQKTIGGCTESYNVLVFMSAAIVEQMEGYTYAFSLVG